MPEPFFDNGVVRLHNADARALSFLADESVDCVVTSPPYWGLRSYAGLGDVQLGLEPTPELYVEHLVEIFRELWRVLKKSGVVFLNMGDSYASSPSGQQTWRGWSTGGVKDASSNYNPRSTVVSGLKPKDLVGTPWRVAFALQANGWWLRSDIIWSKNNPMPESVTDRPTRSHEYLFLLAKAEHYYWDQEAVRESSITNDPRRPYTSTGAWEMDGRPQEQQHGGQRRDGADFTGRNRRSVWTIPTQPFPEAHFATFPEALVEPCILAGTSEYGNCSRCGTPWERVVEKQRHFESGSGRSGNMPVGKNGPNLQGGGETGDIRRGPVVESQTIGWDPACTCKAPVGATPGVVLDPFAGSGTVGVVAQKLGRKAVLVELSGDYCELAKRRLEAVPLPLRKGV